MKCPECGCFLECKDQEIIQCSYCSYCIHPSSNFSDFYKLLDCNNSLLRAFEEGKLACIKGEEKDSCPYSHVYSDVTNEDKSSFNIKVLLAIEWVKGFEFENKIQEIESNNIAKSIEIEELGKELKDSKLDIDSLEKKINSIGWSVLSFLKMVESPDVWFKGRYYFREIEKFKKEIEEKFQRKFL